MCSSESVSLTGFSDGTVRCLFVGGTDPKDPFGNFFPGFKSKETKKSPTISDLKLWPSALENSCDAYSGSFSGFPALFSASISNSFMPSLASPIKVGTRWLRVRE